MLIPIGDDVTKRQFPCMTAILIVISLFTFALEANLVRSDSPEARLEAANKLFTTWGVVPNQLFTSGFNVTEYCALVTHIFLHANFWHLSANMLVLWAFGCSLEERLGAVNFLCMFLCWGVIAVFFQAISDVSSTRMFIGASGAISGVLGAYTLSFGYSTNVRLMLLWIRPVFFSIPAAVFGGLWIGLQFSHAYFANSQIGGVAWLMHIVGFLAGATTIIMFKDLSKKVLIESRGNLVLADASEASRVQNRQEKKCGFILRCPHCNALVSDKNILSEQLMRCSSPACGRMILLEDTRELVGRA